MSYIRVISAAAALSIACALPGRADEDITKAAKTIFKNHQDSVVWITAVAKLSVKTIGGMTARANAPDQERKVETTGTVIDPSGLVVTSLSTVDPSGAVDGQEVATPQGTIKLSASARIKDVKLIMPDGTEIPADIVMKDTDLDLAFIRARADAPETKAASFKAVDLKDNAPGAVLDEVVALGRMGENFGRQPSVVTSLVTSETKKPRRFLRVPTEVIGGPVFASDGKVIGITVLRRTRSENIAQSGQVAMLPAVLPASDIQPVAEQAAKAKAPTEDKSESTDVKKDEKSAK